jgi:hypothetical protein
MSFAEQRLRYLRGLYYDRLLAETLAVHIVDGYGQIEELDQHFQAGGVWTFHQYTGESIEHAPSNWEAVRARTLEVAAEIQDPAYFPSFPRPTDHEG